HRRTMLLAPGEGIREDVRPAVLARQHQPAERTMVGLRRRSNELSVDADALVVKNHRRRNVDDATAGEPDAPGEVDVVAMQEEVGRVESADPLEYGARHEEAAAARPAGVAGANVVLLRVLERNLPALGGANRSNQTPELRERSEEEHDLDAEGEGSTLAGEGHGIAPQHRVVACIAGRYRTRSVALSNHVRSSRRPGHTAATTSII